MNTYLPFADIDTSIQVLDDKQLNRQRSDVITILKGCAEPPPVNGNEHNAIRMWRGNERFLIQFGMMACLEWQARGNTDATFKKVMAFREIFDPETIAPPEWFGDEEFHRSHRSHLIKLRPGHYQEKFSDTPDDLPLIWPRSPRALRLKPDQREMARLYRKVERTLDAWHRAKIECLSYAIDHQLDPVTYKTVDLVDLADELEELERLVSMEENNDEA